MVAAATIGAGVLGAGASALGSSNAASAAQSAANTQANAADAATQLQANEFNTIQGEQQPYLQTGTNALYSLASLMGINTPAGTAQGTNSAGFQQFVNSPAYQFPLQQGQQQLDRTAAANGLLLTGGQQKATEQYGQNYASNQLGNYYNWLAGLAGTGQTSANTLGNIGTNTANSEAANQILAGSDRASGLTGSTNLSNAGLGQGLSYLTSNNFTSALGNLFGGSSGSMPSNYYSADPSTQADYSQLLYGS